VLVESQVADPHLHGVLEFDTLPSVLLQVGVVETAAAWQALF